MLETETRYLSLIRISDARGGGGLTAHARARRPPGVQVTDKPSSNTGVVAFNNDVQLFFDKPQVPLQSCLVQVTISALFPTSSRKTWGGIPEYMLKPLGQAGRAVLAEQLVAATLQIRSTEEILSISLATSRVSLAHMYFL